MNFGEEVCRERMVRKDVEAKRVDVDFRRRKEIAMKALEEQHFSNFNY